jgi:protein-glutamine gamma-glutamyltransferase
MTSKASPLIRRMVFGLVAIASVATEISAAEYRAVATSVGVAPAWIAAALALAWLARRAPATTKAPPRYLRLLLFLFAITPFVMEPFRRRWTGEGHPLELQAVFAFRNLGLGLAALGRWPLYLRLAAVVSLFLILFTVSLNDHPAISVLLALYSIAGSLWLMLVYWTGLRRFFAAPDTAVAEVVGSERFPWVATCISVGFVCAVLGLVSLGPGRAARVLGEWLPTSGGTGGYDPFARGGVNDGDDEVSGDNPCSTGLVDSDQFLDSPLPTLYDLANDFYGEPFKTKERERSIALDSQTKVKESNKRPSDNQRPSREFPTGRKGPRQPRESTDRAARALFEVEGRTPLHVRVAAFDDFDGESWREAPIGSSTCGLEKEANSLWMRVWERPPSPVFAENEGHKFKITSSLGTLIPTPPHLVRFRVGLVDQAQFFAWGQDRILRMALRKTPSGISVESECRTVDPRKLPDVQFASYYPGAVPRYSTVPPRLDPEVAALAKRWSDGSPQGWPQIAAVVERLRSEYVHDPSAHAPEGCADPLAYFLMHDRRGPDYQFASSAAVLARVLGYSTRLVSGFYVSPDHYDPVARHTPVVNEDLHFWAEVMLPSGDWLVLEPTPGYDLLGPSLHWSETLLVAMLASWWWLWDHVAAVSLCCCCLVILAWKRFELLDTSAVLVWRVFLGRSWRGCVRRTLRFLEWRGRCVGLPRPPSQTPSTWLRDVGVGRAGQLPPLHQLAFMAEWCSYAPSADSPWRPSEVREVCRAAISEWTVRRLRSAGGHQPQAQARAVSQ